MTPSLSLRTATSKDARTCAEITVNAYSTLPLYRRAFPRLSECVARLIDARIHRYEKLFRSIEEGASADRFVVVHHDKYDVDVATVRWTIVTEPEDDHDGHGADKRVADVQRAVGNEPIDAALLEGVWLANDKRHRSAIKDGLLSFPHMYMHSMATQPAYTGIGAASLALAYVMKEADAQRLPVYLDATHVAAPLYKKFGFQTYATDRFDDGSNDGEEIAVEAMIRPAKTK